MYLYNVINDSCSGSAKILDSFDIAQILGLTIDDPHN